MSKKKTVPAQKTIFDSVVLNAIDFFRKSISELKTSPKYSVINFCSAVELFLKARLMKEHWSLIVSKPEQASIDKFILGDFKSVSMNEAIDRLKNIGGQSIQQEEQRCFAQIREHRNKLIHFYHDKYFELSDKKTIQSIVSEQCKGWFYLHRLLTDSWKKEFTHFLRDIEELNTLMKKQRHFLKAKFSVVKKQIDDEISKGVYYSNCFSCGFQSLRQSEYLGELKTRECLVCNMQRDVLVATCPNCEENVYVEDLGEGQCTSCQENIHIGNLLNEFGVEDRPWDKTFESPHAYCNICEYTEDPTVVPFHDKWLCLSCLTLHSAVDNCNYCGTTCTGDLSDSGLTGCVLCDGSIAKILEED